MADRINPPSIERRGTGKEERVHFTVASDKPLSREQALDIQSRAGYNPAKHGFFRLSHSGGRSTWSCYSPESCPQ